MQVALNPKNEIKTEFKIIIMECRENLLKA